MIRTIGSLFAGIGGLEIGLERALDARVLWQVEIDEKCRQVLKRHWPTARRDICDVKEATQKSLSRVDLVCAGFPCQGNSSAGKGKGLKDERSALWYECLRFTEETRPQWLVVENVASGARRWLPHVRKDLHMLGYRTRAFQLSAFDCGAPHRRERVFVLASDTFSVKLRNEQGWKRWPYWSDPAFASNHGQEGTSPDAHGKGKLQSNRGIRSFWRWSRDSAGKWTIESPVPGVAHGLSGRLERERQLGNSVSPEQSYVIGRLIRSFDEGGTWVT